MSNATEDKVGGNGDRSASYAPESVVPPVFDAHLDSEGVHLEFLLDIPLELRVEVGRTSLTMGDLAKAQEGTVIELDRPSGDSLDILVNGKVIARGEAVLVGDRYGVRILEVIGRGEKEYGNT